ncbi:tannase/feruloyl esterase family alpha/beta hydrolase [[Empedobacter] haloabium]|uniref:Tannase/feruloyl esterase family alpha/beta hydrolase n=1 Tax=[Empedobacter] haloabium TaxID=592317 RepID=A0ABZ1UQL5_9BURK
MPAHRPATACAAAPLVAALLAGCGGHGSESAASVTPVACADLASRTVPASAIGLPTGGASVTSAAVVTAATGNYCQVLGKIAGATSAPNGGASATPDIRFQLNLPAGWNGKAVQMGGAGYNGVVVDATAPVPFAPASVPLAQGYATFGSDSGHTGSGASAEFALDEAAIANFGHEHLKKTRDAAVALMRLHYLKLPTRLYFAGASTGGREGMTAIQRYPADYDGVVASAPALNFTGVRLHGVKIGQAAYGTPGGYVSRAKQVLVRDTVMAHCDADDGLADRIVANVPACRAKSATILAALRCAGGADLGERCLSDAQLTTVRAVADDLVLPYRLAHGVERHQGYNILQGADFSGPLGLGGSGTLLVPPTFDNGYLFAQGDGYVKYFVAKNAAFDTLRFDINNPGALLARLVELSATVGATNPDLDAFRARGGKVILMHGLADEVISPNATIAYYQGEVARYGQDSVDGFMRFYTVPGFGHGTGTFLPAWDALAVLDQWVTAGTAPGTLSATDTSPATKGRARPLCRYPAYPRYLGSGSVDAAASFACVSN